jgi:CubicO group peptidase (beta-lactamase class C family)
VLIELIETVSGKPYASAIHELVTQPAGIPTLLGPEMADHDIVAEIRMYGARPSDAVLLEAYRKPELIPDVSVGVEMLLSMNLPIARGAGIPGGGGVARAVDVARLYQAWLHNPALADARGNVRNNLWNETSKYPAHRTLLFEVAGEDDDAARRWFPTNRPQVFGHHGAGGQLCWADPQTRISFCFLHDTLDQDPVNEMRRSLKINELAAACVGS